MNVLVIGGGGREHALAWKLAQSPRVARVYASPGNPGIAALDKGALLPALADDPDALAAAIRERGIGFTVIGPEDPLAAGLVDALEAAGCPAFGPTAAAARLEASKAFAKAFMREHGIPTADYACFDDAGAALDHLKGQAYPLVVKADGLAAGKGVTVCHDAAEAEAAVRNAMLDNAFGAAGRRVVIEEFLSGEEASILAFCDGVRVVPMAASQDHKPAYDGDAGPNTGGMGAYSPAPLVTPELMARIQREILEPCVAGMAAGGTPYRGVLYAGLMITDSGPKVVEFNVRFGDPETQVVLPRMESDLLQVLEACRNGSLDQVEIAFGAGACVSVVLASGGYPGSYRKGLPITGIAEAEALPGVVVFHAGTRLEAGELQSNGGRVLNVTASGADIPQAIERAYAAIERIALEDGFYRTDIGAKAIARLGGQA